MATKDFFLSPELEAAGSKGEGKDKGKEKGAGKEEPNMALVVLHAFRKGKAAAKAAGKDKGKEEPKGKGKGNVRRDNLFDPYYAPALDARTIWALGRLRYSWYETCQFNPNEFHIEYSDRGVPLSAEELP